jgi:predicted TPR repeat methyltransferase
VTAAERALEHFEKIWQDGEHWQLDDALDVASRDAQFALIADRRYSRALEVGCGAGAFSERLVDVTDDLVAIDIAPSAVDAARARGLERPGVRLAAADIMSFDITAAPWDLVVMSETIYCLGWTYSFYELAWMLRQLANSQPPGGRFLMANTYGRERDRTLEPWLIDSYLDLVVRVGYQLERRESVRGLKGGIEYDIALTLFTKPGT